MEISNELAMVFYEMIAGTTSGHMANVPNSPALYAMVQAVTCSHDTCHAAPREEFGKLLEAIGKQLQVENF